MGKITISMAIFNSYVKLPEGTKVLFYQKPELTVEPARLLVGMFLSRQLLGPPKAPRRNSTRWEFMMGL